MIKKMTMLRFMVEWLWERRRVVFGVVTTANRDSK